MKKNDLLFLGFVIVLFAPFFVFDSVYEFYKGFNKDHGFIMSFIKFGILASMGECIGLRIKTGYYNRKGFGILPRVIVWGFLGVLIKAAFVIFIAGTPILLTKFGMTDAVVVFRGDLTWEKVFVAFTISVFLNCIFAPIFMTFHKITDTHITNTGGTLKGLFTRINFREIVVNLDWDTQWSFVFMKTIPFFWIPMHTITFALPSEWQILFAALLGVTLGILLSIASLKSHKK